MILVNLFDFLARSCSFHSIGSLILAHLSVLLFIDPFAAQLSLLFAILIKQLLLSSDAIWLSLTLLELSHTRFGHCLSFLAGAYFSFLNPVSWTEESVFNFF